MNIEREMRTMAASVRQLAQHQAQMQGYIQTMHMQGRNHPHGEDSEDPDEEQEVNSGRPIGPHARGESSRAKTYVDDIPHVGDRGPQPTMTASVFERLGEYGPKNEPQISRQRREPPESPPRNRRKRRQSQRYGDDQQAQRSPLPVITENSKQTISFKVDDDDENLSFSAGIRNASIPYEFRVPKITHYTGKGDPLDHVNTYKTEMSLRGATPVLKCRAFHLTLSGGAKRWYNKLVAGSISSWPELKKTFINYFSSGKPASVPVQRLHDIRQAESEPLQSYLSRFNEEMLFYERIINAEALSALKGGLDMNLPFWRDVHNNNPTTFDQLVEMITETNENMILYRNRGGVASNQMPRMNYGRSQGRQLLQPHLRRRDYRADPNSGICYVASAQKGLLPPISNSSSTRSFDRSLQLWDDCSYILRSRYKCTFDTSSSLRNAQQMLPCPPKLRTQHRRVPQSGKFG
ncbi:Retrotrans gag domain-containing protein [Abeliophyllum distichum]|uniref:Retrotrans gag domain-containing protein n=1 Tax=Abeliophyllum distichum TaxID=126358 RepID=A0ABD1VUL6_9LAMI